MSDGRASAAPVRAVVVDDEPAARDVITTLLANHTDVSVIGEATNGREAVALVRRTRPTFCFSTFRCRISMDSVSSKRWAPTSRVALCSSQRTTNTRFARFDVHALDYILKPFGRPRFTAAVTRALERLSALDALTMQRTLASMADDRRAAGEQVGELALGDAGRDEARQSPPRRLGVRTGTKTLIVDVENVDWVEALGDYARIHAGKQTHLVAQRMHALERLLEAGDFIRIHRSLIVNLRRVRELHRESDGSGSIVLHDGVRLRVARGRWESLQTALEMEEF
jgi:two-component system LytT family response regulator